MHSICLLVRLLLFIWLFPVTFQSSSSHLPDGFTSFFYHLSASFGYLRTVFLILFCRHWAVFQSHSCCLILWPSFCHLLPSSCRVLPSSCRYHNLSVLCFCYVADNSCCFLFYLTCLCHVCHILPIFSNSFLFSLWHVAVAFERW